MTAAAVVARLGDSNHIPALCPAADARGFNVYSGNRNASHLQPRLPFSLRGFVQVMK